jgi:hypothetical protein
MRKYLLPLTAIIMAACSSPKYTYHFDEFDYNSGKGKHVSTSTVNDGEALSEDVRATMNPLDVDNETLVASVDNKNVMLPRSSDNRTVASNDKSLSSSKTYKEMSKAERRSFRKEAKSLIRTYIKAKKAGDEVKAAEAVKAMDQDLKMAAIFGAVGIVALIIGGDVFWVIGGIAMIIGVVFFVLWLTRQ